MGLALLLPSLIVPHPQLTSSEELKQEGLGQPVHVSGLGNVGISCTLYFHFHPDALQKRLPSS